MSHANFLREWREAEDRAVLDFMSGVRTTRLDYAASPFPGNHAKATAWTAKMLRLLCAEIHDQSICCAEHGHHAMKMLGAHIVNGTRTTWCAACRHRARLRRSTRRTVTHSTR